MSARPSSWKKNSASTKGIFIKLYIVVEGRFIKKSVHKIKVLFQLDENNRLLTWTPTDTLNTLVISIKTVINNGGDR